MDGFRGVSDYICAALVTCIICVKGSKQEITSFTLKTHISCIPIPEKDISVPKHIWQPSHIYDSLTISHI